MPKFSVSVPDGLWDEVRKRYSSLTPSESVQEGLAHLVRAAKPQYAPASSELRGLPVFKRVVERARGEARESYMRGFESALKAIDQTSLSYEDLMALDGHLDRLPELLSENRRQSFTGPIEELLQSSYPSDQDVGVTLDGFGFEWDVDAERWTEPRGAFAEGVTEAIRLVLESVSRPGEEGAQQKAGGGE